MEVAVAKASEVWPEGKDLLPAGAITTGLKYAIAILLRKGASISIKTNDQEYQFFTKNENIRGKDFKLCFYRNSSEEIQLPFTIELGKDWTLENAYREPTLLFLFGRVCRTQYCPELLQIEIIRTVQ